MQARPRGSEAPPVSKVQPNEEKTCFQLEPWWGVSLSLRQYVTELATQVSNVPGADAPSSRVLDEVGAEVQTDCICIVYLCVLIESGGASLILA